MNFYLSKRRNHDGTLIKNQERTRCSIIYRFELETQEMIASAIVNNVEVATLHNAQVTEINKAGIQFKGLEKFNNGIFYQEWICGYDEKSHEKFMDMETTQSHLFEGM